MRKALSRTALIAVAVIAIAVVSAYALGRSQRPEMPSPTRAATSFTVSNAVKPKRWRVSDLEVPPLVTPQPTSTPRPTAPGPTTAPTAPPSVATAAPPVAENPAPAPTSDGPVIGGEG